jgi:outer membrane protein
MLNYERAKESEQAKRDSVALDVWTAFQNYKTAAEVLESTNAQLKSARESERVVAGMYKVGRSTMLDWQTSQGDLASAQKQNADAKYDLFIKRAALALAIGELRTDNTDSQTE